MERIMIVDMLNMYYRAYIVDPSLSSNGQPIGGIKGSLKILQKLCREVKPTKVYICWDGREGSSKRRKTIKEYIEELSIDESITAYIIDLFYYFYNHKTTFKKGEKDKLAYCKNIVK